MNRMIFGLGGAAVVVLAAVLALGLYFNNPDVGAPPLPSPTAEPSPDPTFAPEPSPTPDAGIEVGEFLLHDGRYDAPTVTVTIPASGWHGEPGNGILVKHDNPNAPDGAGIVGPFAGDDVYVYGDPCQWRTTIPDTPATTVDEMVAALEAQPTRDASGVLNITVDGHAGTVITLYVPDDAVFAECDGGQFRTLVDNPATDSARYHQDPGQIDSVWILDVDGVLMVFFAAHYEGTPTEHVAEMGSIIESMTFGE